LTHLVVISMIVGWTLIITLWNIWLIGIFWRCYEEIITTHCFNRRLITIKLMATWTPSLNTERHLSCPISHMSDILMKFIIINIFSRFFILFLHCSFFNFFEYQLWNFIHGKVFSVWIWKYLIIVFSENEKKDFCIALFMYLLSLSLKSSLLYIEIFILRLRSSLFFLYICWVLRVCTLWRFIFSISHIRYKFA